MRRQAAIFACAIAMAACADSSAGGDDGSSTDASTSTSTSTSAGTTTLATSSTDASSSTAADSTTGPAAPPWTGPLVAMTFNVLCSFCDASFDPWDERVPYIADTITRHAPDLVGLQELAFPDEVDQILAANPDFAAIWYGLDGENPYPDATILYRPADVEPIDHGFYWLSPTPDDPMSTGFADHFQLARLVTWAVLRRKSDGAELLFATTHFDNNSPSQEKSAPLVLERTPPAADGRPVVLVGDFNSTPDTTAYSLLTTSDPFHFDDAFELAPDWTMDTNQRPPPAYDPTLRIDHVFVANGAWSASRWVVDTWIYGPNDRYISDHFAIVAELALP